ncbi:hypothetical protein EVAR_100074_1 [Eumeta japonica]|uniref:Uncharacterized protein n=1 Tax=Eumeta variegata TaxID=151549 RepID=A0A4C1Z0Q5_EUMVA|nr:hypothetical protein EVAR_100074_1 [Eumeta japonica]
MMIAMKIPERKLIPWQHHIYRNEHVECRDRRDILERRHRKRIPRNSHPRDVTNDDQSTRAHDDPSNKADTSKNRTINGYN